MSNNSFNEIGSRLNKLLYLHLESCNITDDCLVKIGKGCPELVSIDISYCKNLSSDALRKFVSLSTNLKYFTSKGLPSVIKLKFC